MIQVTLSFSTIAAAVAALSALPADVAVLGAPVGNVTPPPAAGSKPPESSAASPKPSTPSPTSAPAPSQSRETPAAGATPLDYEKDVKPLVVKAGGTKGREWIVAFLGKLGVAKGSELPVDKLPEVKKQLEEALA